MKLKVGRFEDEIASIIIANGKCNWHCPYCFLKGLPEPKEAPSVSQEALIEKLSLLDKKSPGIIRIWGGEPLYNKEAFIKVCQCINKVDPNRKIAIVSNGSLLNKDWLDFFKDHNVTVSLSHDGPAQKYRGFDYLADNKYRALVKKLFDNKCARGFNLVIHKYNYLFSEISKYFSDLEKSLDIEVNKISQTLVGFNTTGEIVYNFDYMDPRLITYVTERLNFIFNNNAISLPKYESNIDEELKKTLRFILNGAEYPKVLDECKLSSKQILSINSKGEYTCSNGLTNRSNCHALWEQNLKKCNSCNIIGACPIYGCATMGALGDQACKLVKERLDTIIYAIKQFLKDNN